MAIVRWRPMRDLFHIQDDLNRFVNDFFESEPSRGAQNGVWNPAVDISETDNAIQVTAEIPGMKKEDIKISIHNNVLVLKGEKKKEKEEKEENYHRIERAYGSFMRSFSLPTSVNASKVKAAYKDGILTVELSKKEEAKPNEISINVE